MKSCLLNMYVFFLILIYNKISMSLISLSSIYFLANVHNFLSPYLHQCTALTNLKKDHHVPSICRSLYTTLETSLWWDCTSTCSHSGASISWVSSAGFPCAEALFSLQQPGVQVWPSPPHPVSCLCWSCPINKAIKRQKNTYKNNDMITFWPVTPVCCINGVSEWKGLSFVSFSQCACNS